MTQHIYKWHFIAYNCKSDGCIIQDFLKCGYVILEFTMGSMHCDIILDWKPNIKITTIVIKLVIVEDPFLPWLKHKKF